jgi:hypothetical protein
VRLPGGTDESQRMGRAAGGGLDHGYPGSWVDPGTLNDAGNVMRLAFWKGSAVGPGTRL